MRHVSLGRACRSIAHTLLTIITVTLTSDWGGIAAAQSNGLVVSSMMLSESNLILSGSGGLSGATYYVLASTNVALSPLTLWNKIVTNTIAADGAFSSSIPF